MIRPEIRNFIIGTLIAIGVVIYRDPIIAAVESAIGDAKGWFDSIEAKPHQSERIHELESTLETGTEQSSDDF